MIFANHNFSHIKNLKVNQVRPVNISQMKYILIWLRITMKIFLACALSKKNKNIWWFQEKQYGKSIGQRWDEVKRILRYHVPIKFFSPELFAHHLWFLFYLFRDEERNGVRFSAILSKQTARARNSNHRVN